jgi:hypothetical protein
MNGLNWARALKDESGVALPLALIGLVSITLLVSTALITSSTELAISNAHQGATQALYVAEGGVQAYVAEQGVALTSVAGTGPFYYTPAGAANGSSVEISVVHLGNQLLEDSSLLRLFSVQAKPGSGTGRTVAAIVSQILPAAVPMQTNITSALTLGGNLDVDGNAFWVSGRSQDASCGAGVDAVKMSDESDISVNNENHVQNFVGTDDEGNDVSGYAAIDQSEMTRAELAVDVMGGMTLDQLVAQVPPSKRWGPLYSPPEGPERVFDGYVDVEYDEEIAVVDGDGGTVLLLGGSGVIIIVNGNLEMQGNAVFDGIIIVEGSFWLHGRPQVNGALISLSIDAQNLIELDAMAELDGNITIQYDRCQINEAAEKFGQLAQLSMTPTVGSTHAWQEVVR